MSETHQQASAITCIQKSATTCAQLRTYIAQDSITAAEQVIRTVMATVESLVPLEVRYRGHRRYDLTSRAVLFVNVFDYLIAYIPDDEPMHIIAVLHGRRSPRVLSALLSERH